MPFYFLLKYIRVGIVDGELAIYNDEILFHHPFRHSSFRNSQDISSNAFIFSFNVGTDSYLKICYCQSIDNKED